MVRRFQPAEHRHGDVQNHRVGRQLRRQFAGFAAVRGLAHDLVTAKVTDQVAQAAAGKGLIVGDQQLHASSGRIRVAA